MKKAFCMVALVIGTAAAAAPPASMSVRQQLQDIVVRFSRGLNLGPQTKFTDVHRYTDSDRSTGDTWLCGQIDIHGDGSWRRFYVPPKGELTMRPHENLGSMNDATMSDCKAAYTQFNAGRITRQAALRTCRLASLLAEAKVEQTDFDMRYITWCRLGASAREVQ